MMNRIAKLTSRAPWRIIGLVALAVVVWMLSGVIRTVLVIAAIAVLIALTYRLLRRDLPVLVGGGDQRPWLVRMREHRWAPVESPLGEPIPRGFAYAGVLVAWWWLLS